MSAIYKAMSALLSYPERSLQDAAGELLDVIAHERALPPEVRLALARLVREISGKSILDAQSYYVDQFDRTRTLSLHMFEHVHGESRDRGQAMVSLLERYREAGLDISVKELPDYVPLFLEFLAQQSPEESRAMLAEPAHIFAALGERLKKRGSAYAAVFEALVALSDVRPDRESVAALHEAKLENPNDLAALDHAWEEAEVRFGPDGSGDGSCPRAAEMLQRMSAPHEQGARQ